MRDLVRAPGDQVRVKGRVGTCMGGVCERARRRAQVYGRRVASTEDPEDH